MLDMERRLLRSFVPAAGVTLDVDAQRLRRFFAIRRDEAPEALAANIEILDPLLLARQYELLAPLLSQSVQVGQEMPIRGPRLGPILMPPEDLPRGAEDLLGSHSPLAIRAEPEVFVSHRPIEPWPWILRFLGWLG